MLVQSYMYVLIDCIFTNIQLYALLKKIIDHLSNISPFELLQYLAKVAYWNGFFFFITVHILTNSDFQKTK